MNAKHWILRTACLAWAGLALLGTSAALAQGEIKVKVLPDQNDVLVVFQEGQEAPAEAKPPANDGDVFPAFWIGLSCDEELGPALRAQLGLPEDQGLIVRSAVKDAPADKAGLKEHDVLISAAGKPLKTLRDLVDAVQGAKETELTIDLLRGGKPESVKVTPAKRPVGEAGGVPPGLRYGDPREVQRWTERLFRKGADGEREFQFFMPQPGVMLPPGDAGVAKLPDDMSFTVTKQGAEPAKITVKQGDKVWNTTEDNLKDLPDEVRQHLEGFLGRHPLRMHIERLEQAWPKYGPPGHPVPPPRARPAPPRPAPDSAEQLERLQNELRRLQEAVDKLRQEGTEKK